MNAGKLDTRILLLVIAFVMGFAVMSLEMVGSRYLTPYFGSSIFAWGAIISTVLAALSVGYFFGGQLADRRPDPRVLAVITIPAAIYLAILPMIGGGLAMFIADNVENYMVGVLLASLLLICPPIFFMGTYSPFIVRLVLTSEKQSGRISGLVYGVSNIGSIMGTLVTTFFLIPAMGSRMITVVLSLLTFTCIVALMFISNNNASTSTERRSVFMKSAMGTILFLALLAASFFMSAGPAHAGEPIVKEEKNGQIDYVESPYNTIIVMRENPYVSMQFGYRSKRWVESRANPADPTELPVQYTRLMATGLAYAADQKDIAIIGLGGGTTSRYLSHYLTDAHVTAVELDPSVVKLAKKYFGVAETERLKLVEQDGRMFLRRNKATYDIVMVDAYRGWFVPFHLLTVEFYDQVKRRLNDGGVLVQNIEPSTMLYDAAIATLKRVFDHVDVYDAGGNIVAVAYSGEEKSAAELSAQARQIQDTYQLRYDLPSLLEARTPLTYDATARALTDDFAPANMLNNQMKH